MNAFRMKSWTGALLAAAAVVASAPPARAAQLTEVTVGSAQSVSDAMIYIADKKGYFAEEGIRIKIEAFASAANMVAPMGAGQLDVARGDLPGQVLIAVADAQHLDR